MKIVVALLLSIATTSVGAKELLLFGGRNHDVFLGCLTCGKWDSNSICNLRGNHGLTYNYESIWNHNSRYGYKYHDDSPWSKSSPKPPAIVDRDGGFYGYFTANRYISKRTQIPALLALTDNADLVAEDLEKARDLFCSEWDPYFSPKPTPLRRAD